MAYSRGAFLALTQWLGTVVPRDGAILELGCQEINEDVSTSDIAALLAIIHRRSFNDTEAAEVVRPRDGRRYIYMLFENGPYFFRYVDLYAKNEAAIVCDLNNYQVQGSYLARFDLVTNFGTSEHILNQLNVMECIHNFLKPGGSVFHSVPCAGYYNHGLFNYHPIFFLFMANANHYEIAELAVTAPHLPYTLNHSPVIKGAEHWGGRIIDSGIVNCRLKKLTNSPFQPFTDFDRALMPVGERVIPELDDVLQWRYDLQIRAPTSS